MNLEFTDWQDDPSRDVDTEGAYDAQLSLPMPSVAPPAPFTHVVKRDGRDEFFTKDKIAEAILKAASHAGGMEESLAMDLASAVSIYLVKRLRDQKPGVDHIHDAVEQVLVQMGQPHVALSYARYRDRRARIRRLRQGDVRMLMLKLEEGDTPPPPTGAGVLYVQTSSDSVATWDREKIVEALALETGLERSVAMLIALEVEDQIQKAEIRTLTTSLVREMVDARLVEHGLEEHRERHRRLGVPMFDCEGIVRGATEATVGGHPLMTDWILGQAVKKEFALARVFSPDVAEAHLMGELHLEGLGVVDRLYSGKLSLMPLLRQGLILPGCGLVQRPARHAEALLNQWVRHFGSIRCCVAGPVLWQDINWYLAPFVREMESDELEDFLDSVVSELSFVGAGLGLKVGPLGLGISWTTPQNLHGVQVVGPDGRQWEETYNTLAHTAQRIARALITVMETCNGATLHLALDDAFFKAPGHDSCLAAACRVAGEGGAIGFQFNRENGMPENPLIMQDPVAQRVILNLPRAAYCSGKPEKLFVQLDELVALAARAVEEKCVFVESLMDASGNAPLSTLTLPCDDKPLVKGEELVGEIAVEGLMECVQTLLNAVPWESEEAGTFAESLLQHLKKVCNTESTRRGITLRLVANAEDEICQRFALLDSRLFPKTAQTVIKINPVSGALHYTAGVELASGFKLSPMECARLEGRFHAFLDGHPCTTISLPRENTSPTALADFLRKAWQHAGVKALQFV